VSLRRSFQSSTTHPPALEDPGKLGARLRRVEPVKRLGRRHQIHTVVGQGGGFRRGVGCW